MFKLKKQNSYINTGNYLSKSLILKENLKNIDSCFLIVESKKDLENYKKIFDYLFVYFREINKFSQLTDLLLNKSGFFIVDTSLLEERFESIDQIKYKSLKIEKNIDIDLDELVKGLVDLGYNFSEYNSKGSYKKSGDTLSITSSDGKLRYDISLWGNTVEEINKTNILTELKKETSNIDSFYIGENKDLEDIKNTKTNKYSITDLIQNDIFCILDSLDFNNYYDELNKKLENYCSFDFIGNKNLNISDAQIKSLDIKNTVDFQKLLKSNNTEIYTRFSKTIKNFLEYNSIENIKIKETKLNNLKSFCHVTPPPSGTPLEKGRNKIKKEYYICDDIISQIFTKKRIKKNLSSDIDLLLKITPGDYIVHIDHGIGVFKKILKKELGGIIKEYVEIEYANDDKLFVPITEVSRINKYLGSENPKLTGLNTNQWEKKIKKAEENAIEIAEGLLQTYANRKLQKAFSFAPDIEKEKAFRDSFPYIYTKDQAQTIEEILSDMEKPEPMDRLIVGDVGFGKTELAFNAIYRAFLNKKQSVFISPLVVLAYEHFEKAIERFNSLGVKVGVLTRLETTAQANKTIEKIKSGELDLIIGTHKLLSENIVFKNLGLIVVDEEHKFGVNHKEKIKQYKSTIDILSMSATPIPRSLNMALSSLRDISILKTAPYGRQDIQTIVNKYNQSTILEAGIREFERGGQMFFVHNRVSNIENIKKVLQNIFPDKKIIVTHGQLSGDLLEKRIIDFKNKKYDILLSTTVIENGIDFSNVNTIIINDAERFGLSQIHQLRGRVGRSDRKGYCYLLYKKENIKEDTAKRLKTIVQYSYLGAGFELAIKDLEIRGGGEILGFRQSGQVSEIGVNLFLKMVEEKVEELKNTPHYKGKGNKSSIPPLTRGRLGGGCKIDLNISLSIPDSYFDSELDKLNFYREIESINDIGELDDIITEFKNLNSHLPTEANNLFDMLKLKIIASGYGIEHIKKIGINYQIDFKELKSKEEQTKILKRFLDLDKEVKFVVNSLTRIRTANKNFENEKKFIEYLLLMFEGKIINKKLKLKKKI